VDLASKEVDIVSREEEVVSREEIAVNLSALMRTMMMMMTAQGGLTIPDGKMWTLIVSLKAFLNSISNLSFHC
jgi:hypothetical protein